MKNLKEKIVKNEGMKTDEQCFVLSGLFYRGGRENKSDVQH
ncbi:MAG: hypothetical protein WCS96_05575 [Victivallales bacterium]|jgi:hypothetical protein